MTKSKRKLYEGYGYGCVWCSQTLTESTASVDHVICSAAGGSNWKGNLLPACKRCNIKRGDKIAEQWLVECLQKGYTVKLKAIKAALLRVKIDPRSRKAHFLETGNENNRIAHYRALHIRHSRARMLDAANWLLGGVPQNLERVMTHSWRMEQEIHSQLGISSQKP